MTATIGIAVIWLALGALIGLFYLRLLRLFVEFLFAGGSVIDLAVLGLSRLLLVAGMLILAVDQGALPLIAAALGFGLARLVFEWLWQPERG